MRRYNYIIALAIALVTLALLTTNNSTAASRVDKDVWKDVSQEKAIAFIDEFYSHAPKEGSYEWDEKILKRYLAPEVLQTLRDSVKNSYNKDTQAKYATWLLTGIDNSEMIWLSKTDFPVEPVEDGRYAKTFKVFYWADPMLSLSQTLFFTVKSKGGRLYITKIDNLNGETACVVWKMLEERNRWNEVERKAQQFGGVENLTEEQLDSLYQHAFDE